MLHKNYAITPINMQNSIGIPLLDILVPKIGNCLFKVKFGAQTNSNMQNSRVVFIASVLDSKYPFWASLVQKMTQKNNLLKKSNMKNSMLMFTLSVFDRKYSFYGKFFSKNQISLLNLKFRIYTNSNMQNLMVIFILFFFILEIPCLS